MMKARKKEIVSYSKIKGFNNTTEMKKLGSLIKANIKFIKQKYIVLMY